MLTLSCLRHGETAALTQGLVLRGQLDDPLTIKGKEQMHIAFDQTHQSTQTTTWQAIMSSPLSRCADIAQHKSVQYHLPLYVLDELGEMDFGDWEGKFTAELFEQFPNEMATWWQSPTQFTPPNGESVNEFAKRIDEALINIEHIAKSNQYNKLCIITHGGVIKYLYCKAQKLSLDEILKQPAELGEFHHFSLNDGQLSSHDLS